MAFTTWAALKTTILDGIADGSVLTKSYTVGDVGRTLRDMSEVIAFLKFIDYQISAETSSRRGPTLRGVTPV
jgi:hypothetical protein